MEIPKPIIVPRLRPEIHQILRISALANLETGRVEIEYGTDSPDSTKTDVKATCSVIFGDAGKWLNKWSRTAYLVQKRIEDLERGVQQGTTHKIFRKMAYKLFKAVVDYDSKYQGMDHVLLDSEELEGMAILKLCANKDAGTFFYSPFWIDSLVHLAGFVMNANDAVDSQQFVYISHGWGSMRLGEPIDPTKPYTVHVKMQPVGKTMVAGDVSVFQGGTMTGLIGDLKFQQVPRSLLNHLLPPPSLHPKPKPQGLAKAQVAQSQAKAEVYQIGSLDNYARPARPQKDTAGNVLDIVAEQIGISLSELSDDSKFSELGIDSLMSLTILSKLREILQLDLPQTTFEDYATVKDLLSYLQISNDTDEFFSTNDTTPVFSGAASPNLIIETQALIVDDTVAILRSTIAEQIGVEVEELLATEDLSTLGVDSLMSLSILGALHEKAGLSVPSEAIEGNFSLSSIEKALNLSPPSAVQTSKVLNHPRPKSVVPVSVLLQGDPSSASKKLFLFPDGSGSAMSYAKMPRIPSNTCIFGLNSPFLIAGQTFDHSVEDLATIWVDEIRSRQARGPYFLGGWSAGGYFAFEAAKQLIQAGETVQRLILIDSPCRLVYDSMPLEVLDFLAKSGVIGNVDNNAKLLLPSNGHFVSTIKAIERYRPTPFSSMKAPDASIIWASDGVADNLGSAKTNVDLNKAITRFLLQERTDFGPHGWEKLLSPGAISITSMPGNHFTIVQPPNVSVISFPSTLPFKD